MILKAKTKAIYLTAKGTVNKNVKNALRHCRFNKKENKIYTGYYLGTGRFTTKSSAMFTVKELLKAQGYKFTTGNDSSRGDASGEFVKVSSTAFNFINSL